VNVWVDGFQVPICTPDVEFDVVVVTTLPYVADGKRADRMVLTALLMVDIDVVE
jgi:hypothetical protein